MPSDGARDVPDIALSASFDYDGYLICSEGSCVNGYRAPDLSLFVVGGTSAGAPTFAAIVALINQQTGARQGNVNPRLYQLAATSPNVFHDILSGDNRVPCRAGTPNCPSGGSMGFSAGPGYDQVTGLGSVDAFALANAWVAPAPALTSLAPATATAGGADFTLTVNGANFLPGAIVQWNGTARSTSYLSVTQLTAVITADDILAPGVAPVTVVNPAPSNAVSNALPFTVTGNNPLPVLTSVSPGARTAGSSAFPLTVTGAAFVPGSVVQWNGQSRTTTYGGRTQLTASITAADIAVAGTATVTVFTPTPGGGSTASVPFYITTAGEFRLAQFRYWPHIVSGGGYVTKMTITNLTNAQNAVVVYFVSQAGATVQTASYSLPAGGTVRFATDESARFGPRGTQWAIVNSQSTVGINLFFEIEADPTTGVVINTLGFNEAPPLTDFTIPVEFMPAPAGNSVGRTIGLALANTTSTAATITLKLLDQSGNILATTTLSLDSFAQTAFDVGSLPAFSTFLPTGTFIGSITVSSTQPLAAIGLEDDLGPFSAIPPMPGRAK